MKFVRQCSTSNTILTLRQFSLVDIRPLYGMADVCERHNVKLLTYGTLVSIYGCQVSLSYSPCSVAVFSPIGG